MCFISTLPPVKCLSSLITLPPPSLYQWNAVNNLLTRVAIKRYVRNIQRCWDLVLQRLSFHFWLNFVFYNHCLFQNELESSGVQAHMSNKNNLKQRAQRKRRMLNNEGNVIRNYSDLDGLPESFKNFREKRFLVLDHATASKQRILIFMSESGRQMLESSKTWAMDGTHPKVPAPFKQLYFIGKYDMIFSPPPLNNTSKVFFN